MTKNIDNYGVSLDKISLIKKVKNVLKLETLLTRLKYVFVLMVNNYYVEKLLRTNLMEEQKRNLMD